MRYYLIPIRKAIIKRQGMTSALLKCEQGAPPLLSVEYALM